MSYQRIGSVQSSMLVRRQVPRYATVRRPGSLADDASVDAQHDPLTQAQFNQQMLATMQSVRDWQQRWVQKDELQRWLQLAATVSIPLFAGLWRAIGFRKATNVT